MARRLISAKYRGDGGPVAGGSGYELKFYDDEALTTPSTLFQRSAAGGNQPNPIMPNAGMGSPLLADRLAGDAFVTVQDVTGFQVGDMVRIRDGVNQVFKIITIITPATKRLDLDQTLGFAFTVAGGTTVGDEDLTGHFWVYVDDTRDYYCQPKDVASGRLMPPLQFPVRAPTSPVDVMEEGVLLGNRPRINFIGGTITAVDDAGNNRFNVTVAAGPDNASYVTMAAEAGLSAESVLGTAVIMAGTNAGRPAAATSGRIYATTDAPVTIQRDNGASWLAAGFQNPMTTAEDLIKGGTSGAQARLAKGADNSILQTLAGVLTWAGLTTASALLGTDVTMTTNGTWYDGASVSLAAGTWIVIVWMTVVSPGSVSNSAGKATLRLWDGTTTFGSIEGNQYIGTSGTGGPIALTVPAIITLGGTTTIKGSASGAGGGVGTIKAAAPDNGVGNNATGILAVRVGP